MTNPLPSPRRIKVPHVFALLTGVILVCSVLTYIIPSGSYQREVVTVGGLTRTVVLPGTYERLPKETSARSVLIGEARDDAASPTSVLGFLTAIPRGMEAAADIIFFIFVIGGVFGILQRTGMIAALLQALLDRFSNSGTLLTVVIMLAVAVGGSTLGMGEELIPLVPIFIAVSREMGYDRVFGLALVFLGSAVGFAAATTNPFTVQIAQGIAQVPLGSGMGLRLVFFACALVVTILYVLRYGRIVKQNPSKSLVAGVEDTALELSVERTPFKRNHLVIALLAAVIFAGCLYAVQTEGWWLAELGGGFLLIGMVAAALGGLSVADATNAFVKGAGEMVVAALVVGFARGIQVVLEDAQVMDTIIFSAASVLGTLPNMLAAQGMFVFQSTLNFFIPSGSGQAAVTMPLMAPLADVLGLTRQTAVFAFTSGDGLSNTLIPTSGILMAMIGLAGVPYEKWLRFVLPLFLLLSLLAGVFLALAVWVGY